MQTTDGYADQFSGEAGKKLGRQTLKKPIIRGKSYRQSARLQNALCGLANRLTPA